MNLANSSSGSSSGSSTEPASASAFIPVILSGGSGTRLWPVSRQSFPKQFCELFSDAMEHTLFSRTLARVAPLSKQEPWTITTRDLKVLTEKALKAQGFSSKNVVFEPRGRNTAPAIALLCKEILNREPKNTEQALETVCGVFPADQLIENEAAFRLAVSEAIGFAAAGEIVTLGVQPTYPATGYGYIETTPGIIGKTAVRARRFREKPGVETARQFLLEGCYFWNAGMFVFKVKTMVELLKKYAPDVWNPIEQLKPDQSNLADVYEMVQPISIDYAVMERLESHVTIPCTFDWSDVGSWDAMAEILKSSKSHHPTVAVHAENCFVMPNGDKTYAVVGARDLLVVDTDDALLIVKRDSSEHVKEAVEQLKTHSEESAYRALHHEFEVRPWGQFEVLRDTEKFKSKTITVDPGAQISYQSHAKRAEHWIIVGGRGEVVLNEQVIAVQAGSHVHIPVGAKHRIRNTGPEPIEFVEVQLGTYFGEDDIVRYEDTYGRA